MVEEFLNAGLTSEQARRVAWLFEHNPTAEIEFLVCDHSGVIVEIWPARGRRQWGKKIGLRADGGIVHDDLAPAW